MNLLTIAELKRRGMAAIEEGLRRGPVHIVKRNKPAAVVLSEAEYRALCEPAPRAQAVRGMTALQWLAAQAPKARRSKAELDAYFGDRDRSFRLKVTGHFGAS
jgi:prevent-host-death family protein